MDFTPRGTWVGKDRDAILKLIYKYTHADFKGMSGERWGEGKQGYPTIVVNHNGSTALMLLQDLSDEQINSRLEYVAYRHEKATKEAEERARVRELVKASTDAIRLLVPGVTNLVLKASVHYDPAKNDYVHLPVLATFEVEGKPSVSLTEFAIEKIRQDCLVEQQALSLVTHHKAESGDPVLLERLAHLILALTALAGTHRREALSYNF